MGLFQKRPPTTNSQPLYRLGQHKTVVVVGLGNPGRQYDGTRHNIGFSAIDFSAQQLNFPSWLEKKDLNAWVTSQNIGSCRVILTKPNTFMNHSGEAVQAVLHFFRVPAENCLVIHDELAIPFGQIRTRTGGSSAGHNGVESVIRYLGERFGRIRVGIGNDRSDRVDSRNFVLRPFTKEEQQHLPTLLKEAHSLVTEYIYGGELGHVTRSFIV